MRAVQFAKHPSVLNPAGGQKPTKSPPASGNGMVASDPRAVLAGRAQAAVAACSSLEIGRLGTRLL
jgi:hypothetical protein